MKPRSSAAFIGAASLLSITFGVGLAVAGPATVRGTSVDAALTTPDPVGPGPVLPRGAQRVGALAASTTINVDVMLAPSSAVALEDYAANVSSPGNSLYHRYLTVGQFASMFGPTAAAISTVEASLQADGLTPGPLSANHLMLPVTATAGQFAKAFSIGFDQYRLSSGRTAFANTSAPRFPGAAAQYISAVIGLDTVSSPQPIGPSRPAQRSAMRESPQVVTGGPQPCSAAVNAASGLGAYTADQIASAYNLSGLYGAGDQGSGVTAAILELEPNLASDISAYQSCYGTNATVSYIPEDGGAGSGPGSGEAALDIENVIGLAPRATIDVYQAPNTVTGWIDDITAIVDNNAVHVMSTSWGQCESLAGASLINEENTLFEQAATEGMSVFAAAGDHGSTDCATSSLAVDDPGAQPFVTSVGGTSLTSISPPAQAVWNDSSQALGAGGGGISSVAAMPAYQSSAPAALNVINSSSSGSPCGAGSGSYCREVPDVSASADPDDGYLIYYSGNWGSVGGTSASAPFWAAFTALTDASSTCAGTAIGFANPLLYQAAASGYAANFSDVTSGNNDYTPDGYTGGLYPAGTGYDMASGLGTPNGTTLAHTLCSKGGAANTVTVTNPGNQTTTVGATVSLQVAATDSAGASLTFTATGVPPGLSISPSGLISGSPTAAGTYPVTVTATDTTGASGLAAFTFTVNQASQSISFTAPATGTVGGTATLSATGGGSGNPVVFSVDTSSGTGVCTVSGTNGTTVNYTATGSCVIDANQAGNASFTAAPQVTQTITVGPAGPAAQTISFTAPATGTVGGTATLTATGGGSGNPVVFSVDTSSGTGVCTVSGTNGTTVNYTAAGSCVIDANQAGNASFTAAPQVTQTITIDQASQSISFTAPANGTLGGSATLTATGGGSGNPVVFSVDTSSGTGVCNVSGTNGATVKYTAAGSCVIDANQAGNASFSAAPQVTQTITVVQAPAFVIENPPLTAAAGRPYSYTFTAAGTPAPKYELVPGAPSWLSVNASTGEVTGTPPTGTTSFRYEVAAVNVAGVATAGPFTVTVTKAPANADISVVLSCPASMTVGGTVTCKLKVANAGPATASRVAVGVQLPAALREVSCTSRCARHANVYTWTLSLASGASAKFSITAKASAAGKVRVLATAVSQNPDPHPRNNTSSQQITIKHRHSGRATRPRHHGR